MLNNKAPLFMILLACMLGFSGKTAASVILHDESSIPLLIADRTQSGPNYDEVFQQMDQRKWQHRYQYHHHSSREQQGEVNKTRNSNQETYQGSDSNQRDRSIDNHD